MSGTTVVRPATWKWLLSIAKYKRANRTAPQTNIFNVVANPLESLLSTIEAYEDAAAYARQRFQWPFT